jgi:hypothetical protein
MAQSFKGRPLGGALLTISGADDNVVEIPYDTVSTGIRYIGIQPVAAAADCFIAIRDNATADNTIDDNGVRVNQAAVDEAIFAINTRGGLAGRDTHLHVIGTDTQTWWINYYA